jgi:long-chain acyl-CoA synthetase
VPAGEVGEVVVRGESVMQGYWQDPQASEKTLRHGWLHTGDMGVLDANGFLTLKDRSKDLVISGGSNIYPREVEEVLVRHPQVLEASVIGVADPERGEAVVAFIVTEYAGADLSAELDALCLSQLARFKRPTRYIAVAALPKNDCGKVLRTELRRHPALG